DEKDPAEETGRDVVDVPSGNALFGGECGRHERAIVERTAEQRVGRERAGDGGGGAAALTSGERQSLFDAERAARGLTSRKPQHLERREPARVALGVARKIGMSGLLDPHPRRTVGARLDRIADPGERAAEDVEPGADVADAARSEGAAFGRRPRAG